MCYTKPKGETNLCLCNYSCPSFLNNFLCVINYKLFFIIDLLLFLAYTKPKVKQYIFFVIIAILLFLNNFLCVIISYFIIDLLLLEKKSSVFNTFLGKISIVKVLLWFSRAGLLIPFRFSSRDPRQTHLKDMIDTDYDYIKHFLTNIINATR